MDLILYAMLAVGLGLLVAGVVGFVRERRRLGTMVLMLAGLAVSGFAGLLLLSVYSEGPAVVAAAVVVGGLIAMVLAYPVLAVFLIANGVTMFRRESRTLGNLLSLLTGLLMLGWPMLSGWIAGLVAPYETLALVVGGLSTIATGIGMYFGVAFVVFLLAAVAYRRLPQSFETGHVIVLGSGLIGSRVPPLLAARLDKAIEVAARQDPPAVIIPSGGQGADEDVAEGVAMAGYLVDQGVPRERIVVEDRAVNTRQSLQLSRALMPDPDAPVAVVTTGYHVFRTALLTRSLGMTAKVAGAKTARYYVPSAFLREFVAVMREHWRLNLTLIATWTLMVVALYSLVIALG